MRQGRVYRKSVLIFVAVGAIMLAAVASALGFGAFRSPSRIPSTGGTVYGVAVGDVNGDGKLDVVAANDVHVSLLRGKGDGTFKPEKKLIAGAGPEGVAIGQFNGDSRKDLAVANYTDSTVTILLGKAGGGFTDKGDLTAGPGAWIVRATDLNRDGKQDLVTGNYDSSGPDAVSVFLGKGSGQFRPRQDFPASDGPYGLVVGRVNGDKIPDIVTADTLDTVSVLLGRPDGTLRPPKFQATSAAGDSFDTLALGDFNGDGKTDAAVSDYTGARVLLLRGNGDGTMKPALPTSTGTLSPNGIEAADFNRDGKLDVAVASYLSPYGSGVLLGKGNGTFRAPKAYPGSDSGETIAAARLNGDKGTDIVLGDSGGINVYLNKSKP